MNKLKGSSSTPLRVIIKPNDYKEYLYLTQVAKSASISSVAQTDNTSACLTHSSSLGPWILDSGASDHLSDNKDFFSSLTITSPLPMITLVNGSQTMAKRIGSTCLLPSVPLTYVLYIPDFPFNLISINKLTHDLNCLITFSDNFVTLHDQSIRRTIGIGHEFQGLFHLSSPSSSIACIVGCAPKVSQCPTLARNGMTYKYISINSIQLIRDLLGKKSKNKTMRA